MSCPELASVNQKAAAGFGSRHWFDSQGIWDHVWQFTKTPELKFVKDESVNMVTRLMI